MNIIIIYLHTYIYIYHYPAVPSSSQSFLGASLASTSSAHKAALCVTRCSASARRASKGSCRGSEAFRKSGSCHGMAMEWPWIWTGYGYMIYIYIYLYLSIYLSIYLYIYVCVRGYSAECVFLSYHIMNYISYIDQLVN